MEKKKHHADRYAQLSDSFLKYLRQHLPGFKDVPVRVQVAILGMIMQAPTKYRQHASYEGWASFNYLELERKFGRSKFAGINKKLGIFLSVDDWSKVESRTKPYMLTDKVTDIRAKFLDGVTRRTTHLLTEDGDIQRTLPAQAVEAKGSSGQTRKGWKGRAVRTNVPVNQYMLKRLIVAIQGKLYAQEHGFQQGALFHAEPEPKYLHELHDEARMMVHLSRNRIAPGFVTHRYGESDSGRLYARGTNLQNAYRPVRQAALDGMYDYDIENCHYSILEQMAQRYGCECGAIRYYLTNKKKVRESLAADLGIKAKQAKLALIMLVYGATFSENPAHALPKLLGVEKAKAMYQHPQFLAIGQDIVAARSAILKGHPVTRQTIKNLRGLTMNVRKHDDKQQLAHLLQGVEAVALEAAHQLHPDHIVLLQHDGFTATKVLDHRAIEAAIFQATGYRLEVPAGEVVTCRLDDALDDHPLKNQIKIELQPNIGAGFSVSTVS
jgi:hypothetical protein